MKIKHFLDLIERGVEMHISIPPSSEMNFGASKITKLLNFYLKKDFFVNFLFFFVFFVVMTWLENSLKEFNEIKQT